MSHTPKSVCHVRHLAALGVLASLAPSSGLAQAVKTASPETKSEPETVELSPFEVNTSKDRGYRATNSISGTRLNTPIKDLPMPIEVVTEDFLRDTGSSDLRQSLRYSSGILLQTQNDYGAPAGSFATTPGKINNAEGTTASPDQTHFKIRGFVTESVLRDGFRRQNATDSVNIARVEVARGPASLLYGVGNFGGVVNYLPKMPEATPSTRVSASYGSYDFMRATLDTTAAVTESGKLAYRLTAAWQDQGSYTDFNNESHFFVSPVITWKPFEGTDVLFDVEYGKQQQDGIGWLRLRAAASGYVNDSAGYNASFLNVPGRDPKTFRWSGPDTFRDSEAVNYEFKVTQKIVENLHFLAGVNRAVFNYDSRDNLASLRRVSSGDGTPSWAIAPVTYVGLTEGQADLPAGPQDSTIINQWQTEAFDSHKDQLRAELTYSLKLFEGRSRWLRMHHSLLAGLSYTKETAESHQRQTPGDVVNYHSPADYSYFRFGKQGNGTAEAALVEWANQKTVTSNPAFYGVYQGRFVDNRVTLVGGARRDRSWNVVDTYNPEYRSDGSRRTDKWTSAYSTPSRDTTYQYGASVAIVRPVSLYVMTSEGVSPNYQGKLDLYGKPLQAALAKNKEIGLKFDLFNGKLSGTLSKFEITRTRTQVGSSSAIWFAPVAAAKTNFDPTKDIIFRVDQINPYGQGTGSIFQNNKALWDAAVSSGAIQYRTNSLGQYHWYLNASKSAGAALLDKNFADAKTTNSWGGWIWDGADPGSLPFDSEVNNATMDNNGAQRSVAVGSDRASGWDTQILYSPTEDLQFVFSFAHVEKKVLNAAAWPKYPHTQDRWAVWLAPQWPVYNNAPNPAYRDQTDTSTYIVFGDGLALDDTPENQGSFWMNYQFPKKSALKGWSFGVGGNFEDHRQIYPAYGQQARDTKGNVIFLSTPTKVIYNGMLKYAFKLRNRDASVQLNVDNIVDNQKLYGFIYQTPRRWQLEFNYKL